jgi:(p)ppGpp synthase/HD superfamily hydrolase
MTVTGYSDRINHALAFAAKHHDQQVRKGTRLPYFTKPANVAVILTRYAQDDATVVAGILHDTVEDGVRDGWTVAVLHERIAPKFGTDVLALVVAVMERKLDDDGIELSQEERRADVLARLSAAPLGARWVRAASALHDVNTLVHDLARTAFPETVWGRLSAGRDGTVQWYRTVCDQLRAVGFDAPIMRELDAAVEQLAAS